MAQIICIALQVSIYFVWKPEYVKPLDAEPKTDFNAKYPFKVIYFDVTENPISDHIS